MGYFEMSKLALKWALTKPPTTRYPFEPRNPLVWIEMSKIRLASGEAVQAESVARKAVALSEGDQRTSNDAWKQVALALRAQNRNPEAAAAEARANRPYSDGG